MTKEEKEKLQQAVTFHSIRWWGPGAYYLIKRKIVSIREKRATDLAKEIQAVFPDAKIVNAKDRWNFPPHPSWIEVRFTLPDPRLIRRLERMRQSERY